MKTRRSSRVPGSNPTTSVSIKLAARVKSVSLLVILSAINLDKKRWLKMKRSIEIVRVILLGIGTITAVYLAIPSSSESDDDAIESSNTSKERSLASLVESATTQEMLTANIETALASLGERPVDQEAPTANRLTNGDLPSSTENRRTTNLEMKWNKHCAGDRQATWKVLASQGWSIDVGTVNLRKTSRDNESEFQDEEHGISVERSTFIFPFPLMLQRQSTFKDFSR